MIVRFENLTTLDLPLVKDLYNYYVLTSTATYYTEKISAEELLEFIPVGHPKYRSFTIKADGEFCGFCYFGPYKKRQAYDRTAEVSVYLTPGFTGRGIGNMALEHLEKIAQGKGISVLIGIISGDNEPSIKLFEQCGYEKCAHYHQIGEKFGNVLDVVSYQKIIQAIK
jgi:L-amino acid N-acyltransferase YncA